MFEDHIEYKYISSKSQLPPFDKDLLAWVTPIKVNFFKFKVYDLGWPNNEFKDKKLYLGFCLFV